MRVFRRRLSMIVRQPIFIFITIWGHLAIAAGTLGLYYFEKDANPKIATLLDTFYWSIATVTTVGYGDAVPLTLGGKIVGILLMLLGSIFLWSYTALFAGGLVAPEIHLIEEEVKDLEANVEQVEKKISIDEESLHRLLNEVKFLNEELRKRLEK